MFGTRILSSLKRSLDELAWLLTGGHIMQSGFPFALEDIQSWVIRRKDGTVVKYSLIKNGDQEEIRTKRETKGWQLPQQKTTHYSAWCDHAPWPEELGDAPKDTVARPPVFTNGKISLWQADMSGARKVYKAYDVAIDGGDVLTVKGERDLPDIYGDPGFVGALTRFTYRGIEAAGEAKDDHQTRIIKLRWYDRAAPPVIVEFWPALLKQLLKQQEQLKRPLRVLTICQGGHGRSGTALTSLVMCMTNYTPLDALTHIRAMHCSRAIESKVQHEYLDKLAVLLKRTPNALEAEKVPSFKDAFLAGPQFAQSYKDQLNAGKGAGNRQRDEAFL